MDKKAVVAALEEIAELLEIRGENPFKCRAYANAARALEAFSGDLAQTTAQAKLQDIAGIGAGTAEKITELVEQGRSAYLEELRRSVPPGVLEMLRIPGLGPRKAQTLYDKLDLHSIGELEYACKENRLVDLKGFGEKTQANILAAIAHFKKSSGRFLFDAAFREASALKKFLLQEKSVKRCEISGSLRRCKETIGDVDLLIAVQGPAAAVMRRFLAMPAVEQVLARGDTKASVRLTSGLQVDLRAVSEKEFPFAWLYFTGSKEHNTQLRGIAKDRGLKLNEYGLFKGEKSLACKDEADIYRALGLHYIPPEAREGLGEIEFARTQAFPRLVETKDLQGVFHVHSNYSDGKGSVLQMAEEAERLGFKYLGMSDHSQSAVYAGGLKAADLSAQAKEIASAQKKMKKLAILQGTESDILADGSLDYPAGTLNKLAFVIASVHSRFKMDQKQMTSRICKAIADPHTRFLGHLSGRLLLGRDAYPLDYDAIFEAAAKHRVAIEINSNPHRFDLDWRYLRRAKRAGVQFAINPDAHSVEGLSDTFFGIGLARKGWLTKEDIVNTKPLEEIRSFLKS